MPVFDENLEVTFLGSFNMIFCFAERVVVEAPDERHCYTPFTITHMVNKDMVSQHYT